MHTLLKERQSALGAGVSRALHQEKSDPTVYPEGLLLSFDGKEYKGEKHIKAFLHDKGTSLDSIDDCCNAVKRKLERLVIKAEDLRNKTTTLAEVLTAIYDASNAEFPPETEENKDSLIFLKRVKDPTTVIGALVKRIVDEFKTKRTAVVIPDVLIRAMIAMKTTSAKGMHLMRAMFAGTPCLSTVIKYQNLQEGSDAMSPTKFGCSESLLNRLSELAEMEGGVEVNGEGTLMQDNMNALAVSVKPSV